MSDPIKDWGSLQTPYSQEAEEATLGAVIVNPVALLIVMAFLRAEDFFILRHRYIWEALERLHQRKQPVDYLTVVQMLKDMERLAEVGGPVYITQITGTAPDSAQAEAYARIVQAKSTRRRLMAASDDMKRLALDEEITSEQAVSVASKKLMDIQIGAAMEDESSFYDEVSSFFDLVERLMNNPQEIKGIPTGFRDIDRLMLGLQSPDLVIVAGRPGMGKSSYLLSMAMNIMIQAKKRVGLFTLEMGREQIVQRAISLEAEINSQRLSSGNLNADEWTRFVKKTGEVSRLPLLINDKAGLTPDGIRSQLYKWFAKHGKVDVIMVDYLQRMSGGSQFKGNDKVAEVSYIATQLKEIAREFKTPVVSAAQLSRKLEERADKRPILSDLRDSGAIEQEADIVQFIYRDEVYNDMTEFPNVAEIITAKHRNGPTGVCNLYFEKTLTKFRNATERNFDLVKGLTS